jgi:gamma-glutamylcyclotransferase (GGCT)/AIG2-like uncharacterized protein YtfP
MTEASPTAFREPVGADDEAYYFGYGANMSVQSLAARGVKLLDPQGRPSVLRGHELIFNIAPPSTSILGTLSPAFGNVRPVASPEAAEVHGVLHRVKGHAIHLLDTWEGAGYQRLSMPVHPYGEEDPISAFVYIQTEDFPPNTLEERMPGERYIKTLRSGATISGLHPQWLDKLEKHPFHPFPQLDLEHDKLPISQQMPTATEEQVSAPPIDDQPFWTVLDGILLENIANHPGNHPMMLKMIRYRDATETVMSMVSYTDSREEKLRFVHALIKVLSNSGDTIVTRLDVSK